MKIVREGTHTKNTWWCHNTESTLNSVWAKIFWFLLSTIYNCSNPVEVCITFYLQSVCVMLLYLPCCPPHGSLLSLQSSLLSRGQVFVRGHGQLRALHSKSFLMSALCFGCADGSCRLSGVHWNQTDKPEEENVTKMTTQIFKHVIMHTVITQSWSWASAPAWSCPPVNSSESLPYHRQRRGYTWRTIS